MDGWTDEAGATGRKRGGDVFRRRTRSHLFVLQMAGKWFDSIVVASGIGSPPPKCGIPIPMTNSAVLDDDSDIYAVVVVGADDDSVSLLFHDQVFLPYYTQLRNSTESAERDRE